MGHAVARDRPGKAERGKALGPRGLAAAHRAKRSGVTGGAGRARRPPCAGQVAEVDLGQLECPRAGCDAAGVAGEHGHAAARRLGFARGNDYFPRQMAEALMRARSILHGLGAVVLLLVALAGAARAADGGIAALAEAMQLDRLTAVLSAEGRNYGAQLRDELFPGRGGARWEGIVARIHDSERMAAELVAALEAELADRPEAVAAATAFFTAPLGRQIVGLELGAREALLDEQVKDAATLGFEELKDSDPERVALIGRFVAANDLVESNVAGALNANLAFYRGMIDGGAIDPTLNERDMLADLWSQEDQVRRDTEEWLFPYLALAYTPLSDADLEAYVAFSLTPEGQVLNAALFAAFDRLFVRLSYDLGAAAAQFVQGQDL